MPPQEYHPELLGRKDEPPTLVMSHCSVGIVNVCTCGCLCFCGCLCGKSLFSTTCLCQRRRYRLVSRSRSWTNRSVIFARSYYIMTPTFPASQSRQGLQVWPGFLPCLMRDKVLVAELVATQGFRANTSRCNENSQGKV